jgi:prepilin-type processing-associated H-X9-DG protein
LSAARASIPSLVLAFVAACGGDAASPRQSFSSDVEECSARLREIYQALLALNASSAWQPSASGVAFFGELVASGHWPDNPESRARLTCPGPRAEPASARSFADLAALGDADSGYAGRDLAAFPLPRFPTSGQEILMACDNAHGMNHAGVMNALYADGSVRTFSLEQEIAAGVLPAGATTIEVGPSAVLADLQKLRR